MNFYNRHFVLYSKFHYEKSDDVLLDLVQIHSSIYAIGTEYVRYKDIFAVLSDLVLDYYVHEPKKNTDYRMKEFISAIFNSQGNFTKAFEAMLGMLSITRKDTYYKDGGLGEPDARILPLRKTDEI